MIQKTSKRLVIGGYISPYTTTYAIVDIRGNILAQDAFNTFEHPDLDEFVVYFCEQMTALLVKQDIDYDRVRSVGMGVMSGNFVRGSIVNSPSLPWKGEVPLASLLRDRLGLAVAVGNNAHIRALGEHAFGSAHGMQDFIVVTLGPGLGSCVFSNGRPHLGNEGFAGEVGHTCINPDGRLCGCGEHGCLEAYCAEHGIELTAQEMLAESDEPSLMRDRDQLYYKDILDCCEQGDHLAQEVYRKTGYLLGAGMANYASVINPEAIIFTGDISIAGHWLFDPAREAFEENVFHNLKQKVKFLTSTLTGTELSLLGASALAWEVKEYSLFK